MPKTASGTAPLVRPAERILGRAHASVAGLFSAVGYLDERRRSENSSTKGRMSRVEIDVLRSAIVMTSAGLDATMKRLVNDVGRVLALKSGSGAAAQYEEFLKRELARQGGMTEPFRNAVLSNDASAALLKVYLAERTKASFQGSGDLKVRVRQTLGISKKQAPDLDIERLDTFFIARNKISHEMDLSQPDSSSIARVHRTPTTVASQCKDVFSLAGVLIRGAAVIARKHGA